MEDARSNPDGQLYLASRAQNQHRNIGRRRVPYEATSLNSTKVGLLAIGVTFGASPMATFNVTVVVAGAIFLILEMNRPYSGWLLLPSTPLRDALTQMGR
jgi:hypothetical protein